MGRKVSPIIYPILGLSGLVAMAAGMIAEFNHITPEQVVIHSKKCVVPSSSMTLWASIVGMVVSYVCFTTSLNVMLHTYHWLSKDFYDAYPQFNWVLPLHSFLWCCYMANSVIFAYGAWASLRASKPSKKQCEIMGNGIFAGVGACTMIISALDIYGHVYVLSCKDHYENVSGSATVV